MIDNKSPLSLYFQGMVAQNKKDVTTAADLFTVVRRNARGRAAPTAISRRRSSSVRRR